MGRKDYSLDDYDDEDGYYDEYEEDYEKPLSPVKPKAKAKAPSPQRKKIDVTTKKANPSTFDDIKPADVATNVVVVGHVDAGKSTLLGRLLYEIDEVDASQLNRVTRAAELEGKSTVSFAWLLDEGEDERQAGITMDVSFRHFRGPGGRLFQFLDSPGHAEFASGLVKAAGLADLAVLVINAVKVLKSERKEGQTVENLNILTSLGIRNIIVAVNKMDEIEFKVNDFKTLCKRIQSIVSDLGLPDPPKLHFVPIAALQGVNMKERPSDQMPWYEGPTFLEQLELLPEPIRSEGDAPPLVCVYETMNSGGKTTFQGLVYSGSLRPGINCKVYPGAQPLKIKQLRAFGEVVDVAGPGTFLTATTVKEIVLQAGQAVTLDQEKPSCETGLKFKANLRVFEEDVPMVLGRQVMLYVGNEEIGAAITSINGRDKILRGRGDVEFTCDEESWWTRGMHLIVREDGQSVAGGVIL